MAASVVFMLVQIINWFVNPLPPESANLIHSLWNGVNLFNAIFYWTLILLHRAPGLPAQQQEEALNGC